jgi:hypothetical protein
MLSMVQKRNKNTTKLKVQNSLFVMGLTTNEMDFLLSIIYSHSIVEGGLDVTSYTILFI